MSTILKKKVYFHFTHAVRKKVDSKTWDPVESHISEQKQFWQLILITAKEAEEDGLVDLNNFIDVEKLDLEQFSEYDNFNKADLVNILRRYTSFLNMGR